MAKFLIASVAGAVLAALANAQSAPDWKLIPAACAQQCAQTVEASYLCNQQYNVGTLTYGCFCSDYPSDASGCASCLESNNASALGKLLTGTADDCKTQQKACAFQCAFETCPSSDVACQCDAGYLANIYNCASCNTANGNSGATGLNDFKSLQESCANQNYTGASQNFNTWVQSPTGKDSYTAPTLTATGGGEAATGSFAAATGKAGATDNAGASGANPAPTASGTGATVPTGATGAATDATAAATAATGAATAAATGASHAASGTAKASTPASGTGAASAAQTTPHGGALAMAAPAGAAVAAALLAVVL